MSLGSSLFGLLILVGFDNAYGSGGSDELGPYCHLVRDIDRTWRILLGLGCIPAVVALYFRLTIPETPRFTMDIERNVKQVRYSCISTATVTNHNIGYSRY